MDACILVCVTYQGGNGIKHLEIRKNLKMVESEIPDDRSLDILFYYKKFKS